MYDGARVTIVSHRCFAVPMAPLKMRLERHLLRVG
jgi:hypothetical protein